MNNARVQLDSRCTHHRTGHRPGPHVRPRGRLQDRAGRRAGGPVARAERRLHPGLLGRRVHAGIKTFARADMCAPASGRTPARRSRIARRRRSSTRSIASISTSSSARASRSRARRAVVEAVLANDLLVGIHRFGTARYAAEIEYPVKIDQRQRARATSSRPTRARSSSRTSTRAGRPAGRPRTRVHGRERARLGGVSSSGSRPPSPTGSRSSTTLATVRLDGIENAFYRIPPDAPAEDPSRRAARGQCRAT